MQPNNLSILRIRDVSKKTGLPISTIYEYIKKREFPRPISIGLRSVGWVESEVEEWLAYRIEISRGGKNA